jgi:topoisomerase IA-like protein
MLAGEDIQLCSGPFGHYVRHLSVSASVPKSVPLEELFVDVCVELLRKKKERLAAKAAKGKKF